MSGAPRTDAGARGAADPATLPEAAAFFFRHASPRVITACLLAASCARVAVGGWSLWDLAPVALILLYWPLNEWLIHVFVLHFRPFPLLGHTVDFAVPKSHRAHHRDPRNLEILFIPLHSFLYTVPLLVALCFLLAPTRELALTALVAFLALTLHYEWVHFLTHTRYWPRTDHYRRIFRNHRLHHFRNEHYWYGVSVLGADRPLRTDPDPSGVPTSPTCRDLDAPDPATA